jgi:histidinol-phosphatase (PHP family)
MLRVFRDDEHSMIATYHNHSRWSDGKATIAEIIAAAKTMGIDELGISDHWVLHPRKEVKAWAMPADELPAYVEEILQLKRDSAKTPASPVIRLGLEVDWFPGHAAPLREELQKHPFDYLIGSCHEVDVPDVGEFMIDMSPHTWEKIPQHLRNEIHRTYWVHMKSMAESGLFDIVAHIDLPKKFGFLPTIDLNTSGWHKPCMDAYPSAELVREIQRRKIPMTINADAHQPEHLLRDFDLAAQRLAEAGYTHIARFADRQARMEPLVLSPGLGRGNLATV